MRTGGTPEILTHEEDGLLCADTDELGDALARLADDDSLRQRLADGALERARAFAPDVLVPRYEAVYKRLL
jgi:glycosyltransferase involved in cell wall biosynthesis